MKCNRKRCECGKLMVITNSEKSKKKKIRKAPPLKNCIFCEDQINTNYNNGMCTKCSNEYDNDYDLIMFDNFARKCAGAMASY
jgi:hypothetical protein